MAILTQISNEKDGNYLPDLFELFVQLTGDKTLDTMIEHSMRDVLAANTAILMEKLGAGNDKEKKICLQVAGNLKYTDAIPLMLQIAGNATSEELLTDVYVAMSQIEDPRIKETFRKNTNHPVEMVADICTKMVDQYKN